MKDVFVKTIATIGLTLVFVSIGALIVGLLHLLLFNWYESGVMFIIGICSMFLAEFGRVVIETIRLKDK